MSFVRSILFGSKGNYNFFEIEVNFQEKAIYSHASIEGVGLISTIAARCINSDLFRIVSQGYAHVLVHEMGHALVAKLLAGNNPSVYISQKSCTGAILGTFAVRNLSAWKNTVFDVAGPMANVALSSLKLIAATAFKNYLSLPLALILGGGAVIWIAGELLYATASVMNGGGDFGNIARQGPVHLTLASAALVSECALGIFAAIKFAS